MNKDNYPIFLDDTSDSIDLNDIPDDILEFHYKIIQQINLKRTNNGNILLKALKEFYTEGKTRTHCPKCHSLISITAIDNSATTKCDCGLMDSNLRGI